MTGIASDARAIFWVPPLIFVPVMSITPSTDRTFVYTWDTRTVIPDWFAQSFARAAK